MWIWMEAAAKWALTAWTRADALSLGALAVAAYGVWLNRSEARARKAEEEPVLDAILSRLNADGWLSCRLTVANRSEFPLELRSVRIRNRRNARIAKLTDVQRKGPSGGLDPDRLDAVPCGALQTTMRIAPVGSSGQFNSDTIYPYLVVHCSEPPSRRLFKRSRHLSISVSLALMADKERSIERTITRTLPMSATVATT